MHNYVEQASQVMVDWFYTNIFAIASFIPGEESQNDFEDFFLQDGFLPGFTKFKKKHQNNMKIVND